MRRSPEHLSLMARRLKQSRLDAGLTPKQMVEKLRPMVPDLKLSQSAYISKYESGKSRPDPRIVEAWAEITGRPAEWFWATSETAGDLAQELAAALMRVVTRIMSGQPPDEAYDAETGVPTWYNPEARQWLRQHAERMRHALEQFAGQPWDTIDGADKQRIVSEFVRWVLPEQDLGMRRGAANGSTRRGPLGIVEPRPRGQ